MVVTNSSPWYRWPIEIDGLPNLKMGGSFHGKLLNSQMVDILDTHSKKKRFMCNWMDDIFPCVTGHKAHLLIQRHVEVFILQLGRVALNHTFHLQICLNSHLEVQGW